MRVIGDIESVNLSTGQRSRRVVGEGESVLQVDRGFVDVTRLGPSREIKYGPREYEPTIDEIVAIAKKIIESRKETTMHYRNGREAKNGDTIIQIGEKYVDGKTLVPYIAAVGVLFNATAGNDYCNGSIAPIQSIPHGACLCDCLHMDDIAAMLKEKGLDKRPAGK